MKQPQKTCGRVSTILASCLIVSGLTVAVAANAQDTTAGTPAATEALTGLWLTTDYPALTERVGDDIKLDVDLQNKNLPPKRVALSVDGLPSGWTYEIDGGGKPVTAAMVQPDTSQRLSLKLTPPKDIKTGTYQFTVSGKADGETLDLPVTLSLADAKPAKVDRRPETAGAARHAQFDLRLRRRRQERGAADQTFNLLAEAPAGFQVTFKEQYGSQELTSIPIKAGEIKSLKVSVKPPQNVAAGQYTVAVGAASPTVHGQTTLLLDVTGQPTPGARRSGRPPVRRCHRRQGAHLQVHRSTTPAPRPPRTSS